MKEASFEIEGVPQRMGGQGVCWLELMEECRLKGSGRIEITGWGRSKNGGRVAQT